MAWLKDFMAHSWILWRKPVVPIAKICGMSTFITLCLVTVYLFQLQWRDVQKHKDVRERLINELNERRRIRYNQTDDSFTERRVIIGDLVLRKFDGSPTKLHPQWDGPFIIREATPEGVYTLMTSNSDILRMKYNGLKLKKFNSSRDDLYFASEELHRRDAKARKGDLDNNIGNLEVLSGKCIIPNLDLVLHNSISYLPNLTKLELLDILNKANDLIASALLESNMRVTEENLWIINYWYLIFSFFILEFYLPNIFSFDLSFFSLNTEVQA